MKANYAEYNMDTGAIDIVFSGGKSMSILCNRLEETLTLTPPMQSEFTRLVYDDPLTFANLVLDGELEDYLKYYSKDYNEQKSNVREQLEKHYPTETARAMAREFMMYDS